MRHIGNHLHSSYLACSDKRSYLWSPNLRYKEHKGRVEGEEKRFADWQDQEIAAASNDPAWIAMERAELERSAQVQAPRRVGLIHTCSWDDDNYWEDCNCANDPANTFIPPSYGYGDPYGDFF